MPETLRVYVERMSRFTTLADEFNAETPEGEALRERYDDADEYQSDLDDDRLCEEFNCFQEMILDAREALAQPDPMVALEAAEYWLAAEAESDKPGQVRPDDILRVVRDALAGRPMAPLTSDLLKPALAAQCRFLANVIGTDSPQGRQEARQTAVYVADVSSKMLAALRLALPVCEDAHEDAKTLEGAGRTPEAVQSTAAALAAWEAVAAAIAAANGEA